MGGSKLIAGRRHEAIRRTRPATAFGVALFLGSAWLNARTARKRQKDIDTLDAS